MKKGSQRLPFFYYSLTARLLCEQANPQIRLVFMNAGFGITGAIEISVDESTLTG